MVKVEKVTSPVFITISDSATFGEAAKIFATTFMGELHVINKQGNFVGVLCEGDLIRYTLPNFDALILSKLINMEEANNLFLTSGKINADSSIKPLIIYDPIKLDPQDELLKAAVIMVEKNIRSLPVVSKGELIGVVTRASICLGMLHQPDSKE